MSALFYTHQQWQVFSSHLHSAFLKAGFETLEEPHIYYALYGFKATYIRRYLMQRPAPFAHQLLASIIHVVGLPFGQHANKMVVLASPRTIKGDSMSDTLKLRIQFTDDGQPLVLSSAEPQSAAAGREFTASQTKECRESQLDPALAHQLLAIRLDEYVSRIVETVSPKIEQLPIEMKLEILKKMNVSSIIKMSQVNNEFRALILKHGEPLWKHLCERDFNVTSINRLRHKSWMELYREYHIREQIEICRKERALPGLPERPALPPAPLLLQIEWLPEVLELPFYAPINIHENHVDPVPFALEWPLLRRADSLDSLH